MFTKMQAMGFGGLCENLEARRLLSVSLVSGVLTVKGTTSEDSIVVSLVNGDATKVDVAVTASITSLITRWSLKSSPTAATATT